MQFTRGPSFTVSTHRLELAVLTHAAPLVVHLAGIFGGEHVEGVFPGFFVEGLPDLAPDLFEAPAGAAGMVTAEFNQFSINDFYDIVE